MAEKGIEIETVQIDLTTGAQFKDDFKVINPDLVVPALQLDDGTCLSEATAICEYLEAEYPDPPLFGKTSIERGRVIMWSCKAEQQGLWSVAEAFRNTVKGLKDRALPGPDAYAQIPELAERGRNRYFSFARKINEQLADNDYLAGDAYSVADITALVTVDFAQRLKLSVPDDVQHLDRWHKSVSSRPSASA
jgi:glutathione S-transferase